MDIGNRNIVQLGHVHESAACFLFPLTLQVRARGSCSSCATPFSGVVTRTGADASILAIQLIATIEPTKSKPHHRTPDGHCHQVAINIVHQVERGDLLAVISVGRSTNIST